MITIKEFLEGINPKPNFTGKDLGDGVIISEWNEIDGASPSLEFGTEEKENGQYLYYEIVDFGHGYKDGEIIPLDDTERRKDVLNTRLTKENMSEIQKHINCSLERFYGGKKQWC